MGRCERGCCGRTETRGSAIRPCRRRFAWWALVAAGLAVLGLLLMCVTGLFPKVFYPLVAMTALFLGYVWSGKVQDIYVAAQGLAAVRAARAGRAVPTAALVLRAAATPRTPSGRVRAGPGPFSRRRR